MSKTIADSKSYKSVKEMIKNGDIGRMEITINAMREDYDEEPRFYKEVIEYSINEISDLFSKFLEEVENDDDVEMEVLAETASSITSCALNLGRRIIDYAKEIHDDIKPPSMSTITELLGDMLEDGSGVQAFDITDLIHSLGDEDDDLEYELL